MSNNIASVVFPDAHIEIHNGKPNFIDIRNNKLILIGDHDLMDDVFQSECKTCEVWFMDGSCLELNINNQFFSDQGDLAMIRFICEPVSAKAPAPA